MRVFLARYDFGPVFRAVRAATGETQQQLGNRFGMYAARVSDIECGRRAGTRTILVRTGYGAQQECAADWVCAGVVEAVDLIVASV